jgi:hypothetical protein
MADQDHDDRKHDAPGGADDMRGIADEAFEAAGDEDLEDDEQYDANERLTGEVGSEGGSPGETVVTRRRGQVAHGSEAGETWNPEQDETRNVERVGDEGAPRKRNP